MRLAAVLEAMHKGLVEVEDYRHLIEVFLLPAQSEWLNCRLAGCMLVLGKELKEVDGVVEMIPG